MNQYPLDAQSDWLVANVTESRESVLLAPYAMRSRDSAGRRHPEPLHRYRSPYQRDRDRIVHSAAFRRLSGKMQVFTGDRGDYHRTRLTHTMEVASIARTIGRTLRLNEDLIEALALLHDIGHPPFGHAGEDALNECLASEGGFSHNRFALTLVTELEQRYADFPGLNLTAEVLEGQQIRIEKNDKSRQPLLEVQVVDAADSIAYNAHDVDDALKLRLVTIDELMVIPLVGGCAESIRRRQPNLPAAMLRQAIVHELIEVQVGALLQESGRVLASSRWTSSDEARSAKISVGLNAEMASRTQQLEQFLYHGVYRHGELLAVRKTAQRQLCDLFEFLCGHPNCLPSQFRDRAELVGTARSTADYLAGMTDRYCLRKYRQLVTGQLDQESKQQ